MHYDLELHQMKIKITFHNSSLDKDVYMVLSEGFEKVGKWQNGFLIKEINL